MVYGLGGAGKSQLVLHYIREYRRDYTDVFWIEAGSKQTIARDYIQIYRLLYGRQPDTGSEIVKVEDAVPAVKQWFQNRQGRWLLVLDSADTIDNEEDESYIDLGYFIPNVPGLHVVITSRSSTAKETTNLEAIEVGEMEPSEATELFRRMSKIGDGKPDIIDEIGKIVEELGYLALAIILAGSYVSLTPRLKSDLRKYLPEYRQRRKELLQRRPKYHIHQYGESVLSTWEASFDAIANQDPVAARLLSLLAFVNFEDIFTGLLGIDQDDPVSVPSDHTGSPSQSKAADSEVARSSRQTWRSFLSAGEEWAIHKLESCLETLQNYSLLQWKADQDSYAIHKLVHAWSYDRLAADEQLHLSWHSLELIAEAAGATMQKGLEPSHRLRLVPHVMASFGAFSRLQELPEEMTQDMLEIMGHIEDFLYLTGRWSDVYTIRLFHFVTSKKVFGTEHPHTLKTMNKLVEVLFSLGNYEESERVVRQVLPMNESVLGKEHPAMLRSMIHLAQALHGQGKCKEAEHLNRQVLYLDTTVLGEEDPSALMSMDIPAQESQDQSECEEAQRIFRRAYALLETVRGEKYSRMMTTLGNLASLSQRQGKSKEAEQIYREQLSLLKSSSGEQTRQALAITNNLAEILCDQDKHEEARRTYQQTLALSERLLGKEHPDTLTYMTNLGMVLQHLDKQDQAKEMFQLVLTSRQNLLGEQNPSTLRAMSNLAKISYNQGKYEEARQICQQALMLNERLSGKVHPDTLTTMNNLAVVMCSQGEYNQANVVLQRVLKSRQTLLREEHMETLISMYNLAKVLRRQYKCEEANQMLQQMLVLGERVSCNEHPGILSSMGNLAMSLFSRGKFREAEEIYQQALPSSQALRGKKHS